MKKKGLFLSFVTVMLAFALVFGIGANGTAAKADDEPAPGKLLYYVELGSAADTTDWWAKNYTNIEATKTLTNYDTAAGIALATSADVSASVYNSVKERELGADPDPISGKEWGANSGLETFKNVTGSNVQGYKTSRGKDILYTFEVDDNTTELRITLGAYHDWGADAKVTINGEDKGTIALTGATGNFAYDNITGEAGAGSSVGDDSSKFYVKVAVQKNSGDNDPYLSRIFVETMSHSTPLYETAASIKSGQVFYKDDAAPDVKVNTAATTANLSGGIDSLVLDPQSLAAIKNGTFGAVTVSGTYNGNSYSGSVWVMPTSMEYFVDVGASVTDKFDEMSSEYQLTNIFGDGAYDADEGWGYTAEGTAGWTEPEHAFTKSCRYDFNSSYIFTLANQTRKYDIAWGSYGHWSSRTSTMTINGTKSVNFTNIKDQASSYYANGIYAPAGELTLAFSGGGGPIVTYIAIMVSDDRFVLNGGELASSEACTLLTGETPDTVWSNAALTAPAPTRTNYAFGGWYTDADCTTAADFSVAVTDETMYYAKWIGAEYDITYNLNDGVNPSGAPDCYNFGTGVETLPTPTRTGYTFGGWYAEEELENAVASISDANTGNITLFAKWTLATYTITYTLNSGTNPDGAPESYTFGTGVATLPAPTRTNYTFGGWYSEAELTTAVTSISAENAGDITLFAKWTANSYTINYTLNEGTNASNAPTSYTFGTGVASLPTPTREGYTFDGWYSDANFTTKITSISTTNTGNITLYAKWTQNEPENPDEDEKPKKGCGTVSPFNPTNITGTGLAIIALLGIIVIAAPRKKLRKDKNG